MKGHDATWASPPRGAHQGLSEGGAGARCHSLQGQARRTRFRQTRFPRSARRWSSTCPKARKPQPTDARSGEVRIPTLAQGPTQHRRDWDTPIRPRRPAQPRAAQDRRVACRDTQVRGDPRCYTAPATPWWCTPLRSTKAQTSHFPPVVHRRHGSAGCLAPPARRPSSCRSPPAGRESQEAAAAAARQGDCCRRGCTPRAPQSRVQAQAAGAEERRGHGQEVEREEHHPRGHAVSHSWRHNGGHTAREG